MKMGKNNTRNGRTDSKIEKVIPEINKNKI
jgi:hypothetical protein